MLVQEAWGVKLAPGWSMDVPLSGWKGMNGPRGVGGLSLPSAALPGELVAVVVFMSPKQSDGDDRTVKEPARNSD